MDAKDSERYDMFNHKIVQLKLFTIPSKSTYKNYYTFLGWDQADFTETKVRQCLIKYIWL